MNYSEDLEFCDCEDSCSAVYNEKLVLESDCPNSSLNQLCHFKNCDNEKCKNRIPNRFQVKLRKRSTTNKGNGLFAKFEIQNGEIVCEYHGKILTKAQYKAKRKKFKLKGLVNGVGSCEYIMELGNGKFVDAEASKGSVHARFINHQCKSFNCKVEKFVDENDDVRLVVRAVRLIEIGEEVSYCYNINMIDFRFRDGCKCSDCVVSIP